MTVTLRNRLAPLCCLLCGLYVIGQGFAAETIPDFRMANPGYRYEFPRDHGSHDRFRTEWWYYTGNVMTTAGRQLGYQLTFFRRGVSSDQLKTLPSRWSISHLYLAHFAVSDLTNGQFHYAEKISREGLGKAGAEPDRLHVWIDQWSVDTSVASERHRLSASDGPMAIELHLMPEKPPVIHGAEGISRKGRAAGQSSHYYSFTRLATSGRLTIGNETFDVTGTSWMDHEFGSADLGKDLVGWDWFSVQFTDQTELMLYRLRRADGSADPVSSGTFIDGDGRGHHLSAQDFTLEPESFWTSPTSHARYPLRWRVTIPSRRLSLQLIPRLTGQELSTEHSTRVTYWEGAIVAEGSFQGASVRGQGYMELTGYAERIHEKL